MTHNLKIKFISHVVYMLGVENDNEDEDDNNDHIFGNVGHNDLDIMWDNDDNDCQSAQSARLYKVLDIILASLHFKGVTLQTQLHTLTRNSNNSSQIRWTANKSTNSHKHWHWHCCWLLAVKTQINRSWFARYQHTNPLNCLKVIHSLDHNLIRKLSYKRNHFFFHSYFTKTFKCFC